MFEARRKQFMERMDGGVALLFAATEKVRSNDTSFKFRQDSNFHYLTGFPEPEAAALLLPDHPEHKFVMFVRPRDRERETWDGRRAGPEGVMARYGADASYTIDQLPELLPQLLENVNRFHYTMGRDTLHDPQVFAALEKVKAKARQGIRCPSLFLDPSARINEMRLKKTGEEVDRMRRAAAISAEAHRAAMQSLHPGMYEYEIEAILEYTFRRLGASGPAYTTIAGSGVNATILHYIENESRCGEGELLLVDAGAEFEGYSADITRTFPVSGTFTPAQREVYEVVLDAQMKAIDRVRPGVDFDEVHQTALRVLVEGLVKLGVLEGDPGKLIEEEAYKPYYMHRTGHWLGLDVHDVGDYRNGDSWRRLEPGMVLTVEPGLYFSEDLTEVPASYRGMGIRIEDDVLVTEGDPEVLTKATPKTVADVEAAMAESPRVLVAPTQAT
jgi:Xaa-Pro aminopeptidase